MFQIDDDSYFAFAEADYPFFVKMHEEGYITPGMAAMAQNMCERYLKHIVNEYAIPETDREEHRKNEIMRTHSLNRLLRYISQDMGVDVPVDTEDKILKADGYYFSTRYPGDNNHIASERDVERAFEALVATREYVCGLILEFEQEKNIGKDDDELEDEQKEADHLTTPSYDDDEWAL